MSDSKTYREVADVLEQALWTLGYKSLMLKKTPKSAMWFLARIIDYRTTADLMDEWEEKLIELGKAIE